MKNCKEITGCDMIVALEPENLFYMTGFWGEAIGILEKNGKTTVIAPELEVGRAKEEGEPFWQVLAGLGHRLADAAAGITLVLRIIMNIIFNRSKLRLFEFLAAYNDGAGTLLKVSTSQKEKLTSCNFSHKTNKPNSEYSFVFWEKL